MFKTVGIATALVIGLTLLAPVGAAPVTSPQKQVSSAHERQVQYQQELRHPRLLRRGTQAAQPTRWCRRHRIYCAQQLAKQIATQMREGNYGRTRWTRRAVRQWKPRFTRIWNRYYDGGCPQCAPSPGGRQVTPMEAAMRRMAANCGDGFSTSQDAWRCFANNADCKLHYTIGGQHFWDCSTRFTVFGMDWSDFRVWLKCNATMLGIDYSRKRKSTTRVLRGPKGPQFLAGIGAACGIATFVNSTL